MAGEHIDGMSCFVALLAKLKIDARHRGPHDEGRCLDEGFSLRA